MISKRGWRRNFNTGLPPRLIQGTRTRFQLRLYEFSALNASNRARNLLHGRQELFFVFRLIRLCISSDLRYYIIIPADDKSILKVHVIMSPLMSNARMIHRDIAGAGTRAQQNEHARVVNYKCTVGFSPTQQQWPWWTATIQLPTRLNHLLEEPASLPASPGSGKRGPSNKPEFELLDSDTDTDEENVFH